MKLYKARTLAGAEARVRQLQKQVAERDALLSKFNYERKLLAKLAAETPQIKTHLVAMEAKQLRDRILDEHGHR